MVIQVIFIDLPTAFLADFWPSGRSHLAGRTVFSTIICGNKAWQAISIWSRRQSRELFHTKTKAKV